MPTPTASEMLDSVRTEAAELRSFTITFLSLLIYLSLIVVATDHEQILRVDPVTLPLLDVKIPIVGFYQFMPPFLFFMHLYLLVQHYLFSQLAFKFEEALRLDPMREDIRRRLGNLPFMHWLLGKNGIIIQLIMILISLISLVIWPLLMFWWMQARFLPYHDEGIVFWQQSWLSIDVLMLAYLWAKILDKNNSVLHWWRQLTGLGSGLRRLYTCEWRYTQLHWRRWRIAIASRPKWAWLGLWLQSGWQVMFNPQHQRRMQVGLETLWNGFIRWLMALLLLTALGFSWLVSITPDSGQEKRWLKALLWFDNHKISTGWLLTDINPGELGLFVPETAPRLLFKPTAWLHEKNTIEINDSNKRQLMEYDPTRVTYSNCNSDNNTQTDSAKKTQCYLVDSWLPRNMILREQLLTADTEVKPKLAATLAADQAQVAASELNKISPLDLKGRNFDYADFSESSLPRVDLRRASLKHANLNHVRLDQAQLNMAKLEGADLGRATLTGADLFEATLTDADLSNDATLTGADLGGATLTGADLSNATLTGADLGGATLTGADLGGATLTGADLGGATLTGADLSNATLTGANLVRATLTDADLSNATLTGADLFEATLTDADLSNATLTGADLRGATLTRAIILPYSYLPLADAHALNKLLEKYRQQLQQVPAYQTPDGKKTIEQKVRDLRERVGKAANFENIKLPDAPCLTDDPKLAGKIGCLIWDKTNQQDRDKILNFWITQVCQNDNGSKLMETIAVRAIEQKFPSKDYQWPGLATKLHRQDTKACPCPNLTTLSEYLQNKLNAAALEQTNKRPKTTATLRPCKPHGSCRAKPRAGPTKPPPSTHHHPKAYPAY
ncbi:pentapeptide repeat-containing protein [Methylovulum psychrotolerans]|uniref:Pentapeptide repeat-containing protein n=1 Tax=Methylovulum psychrotolerans TaxID=1704499 RepID=A0A1Z4C466_9GAMM|nr:pentapeptide repeat-containing protein [Methylovulum psychrotolerans]ASF48309.1 hypothetical protein CEK71_20810 [Methylovulum psychrotolerans]